MSDDRQPTWVQQYGGSVAMLDDVNTNCEEGWAVRQIVHCKTGRIGDPEFFVVYEWIGEAE